MTTDIFTVITKVTQTSINRNVFRAATTCNGVWCVVNKKLINFTPFNGMSYEWANKLPIISLADVLQMTRNQARQVEMEVLRHNDDSLPENGFW